MSDGEVRFRYPIPENTAESRRRYEEIPMVKYLINQASHEADISPEKIVCGEWAEVCDLPAAPFGFGDLKVDLLPDRPLESGVQPYIADE